ncbi:DUF5658 family protein [Sporosarcina gallistercoris]|uniref:DUF5658 family protein n=1 Tax=Sporosarcina gallistercoris TaxID=2762245 RepID=UPI003D29CF61
MQEIKRIENPFSVGMNRLLWMLLGMSIFDALATDFGLRSGFIEEANPIIATVYEQTVYGFYFLKLGFPFSLFTLQSVLAHSNLVKTLLQFTVGLYGIISGIHVFWILLYLQ